jgi:hypothetical protein
MPKSKMITENTYDKFVIDFFELAFLTEACLPKSTIARYSFFMNVIDIHYHNMSWEQRKHLFEWIGKKLNMEHEESQIFYARFNPDNQFKITFKKMAEKESVEAFLFKNIYWISSNQKVNNDYIDSIEKIEF